VPHGLRSTFRQWAAERGYPRDMAELALAHRVGDETERAYQRSDMLERRRDMMAAWAAFLRGNAGAAEKVVKMARGKA
jgi:integrase